MAYHGVYHLEEFQVPVLLWPRPFSQVTPHRREKRTQLGLVYCYISALYYYYACNLNIYP